MKAGRPIGGRLAPDEKQKALERAREAQKVWRLENPDKQKEYLQRFRERRDQEGNEDPTSILQKFIKRIKGIYIGGEN